MIPEVEWAALWIDSGGSWVVSFYEGSEGWEELVRGFVGVCSELGV